MKQNLSRLCKKAPAIGKDGYKETTSDKMPPYANPAQSATLDNPDAHGEIVEENFAMDEKP